MELSEEHRILEMLLGHPGWTDLMKPLINERAKVYYAQLLDPSKTRKDSISDDFLRGAINALRWVVEYPEVEMKTAYQQQAEAVTATREVVVEIPLFGGGRPDFEIGEDHGRSEDGTGSS